MYSIIVGLGNPGTRYDGTRHNFGFLVLDALAEALAVGGRPQWKEQSGAQVLKVTGSHGDLLLVKPMTFMNRSGEPLVQIMKFFKKGLGEILVLHDELDLPFGTLRLKRGGGEGGHNGLRSISSSLGSNAYDRLRLGIGKPAHPSFEIVDWVLTRFSRDEQAQLSALVERAVEMVILAHKDGLTAAQARYH